MRGFLKSVTPQNIGLLWRQGAVFQASWHSKRNRIMIFFLSSDTRGPSIDCLFCCLLSSDETTLLTQSHQKMCPSQSELSIDGIYTVIVLQFCVSPEWHRSPSLSGGREQAGFYLEFTGTGKFHYLAKGTCILSLIRLLFIATTKLLLLELTE